MNCSSSPNITVYSAKPKIALVADIREWAFANIASHMTANLSTVYDFKIFYTEDYQGNYELIFQDLYCNEYDLIHFFWREVVLNLYMHLLRTRPERGEEDIQRFISTPLTFSVYDHCFLDALDLRHYRVVFNHLADAYTVSSERLQSIYQNLPGYRPPNRVIEDGVDLQQFTPTRLDRLLDRDRPLRVGWVGNSVWGKRQDGVDHKGLTSIIEPALAALRHNGYEVVGHFADKKDNFIPYCEMTKYYASIDIYVCASDVEGTPNPVLEAMACGLPVISTDVGVVPQLFGPLQQEFILKERSAQELVEKLRLLILDPQRRAAVSSENLERISSWTREKEGRKWSEFFTKVLSTSHERAQLSRQICCEVPYTYGLEKTVDGFLKDSLSWRITAPLREIHYHVTRWLARLGRNCSAEKVRISD